MHTNKNTDFNEIYLNTVRRELHAYTIYLQHDTTFYDMQSSF